MNIAKIDGRVITTPKTSYMLKKGGIYVCKLFLESSQNSDEQPDRFPIIAFGELADYIGEKIKKDEHIRVKGFLKNFEYYDSNYTKHCTQVLVARKIEMEKEEKKSGFDTPLGEELCCNEMIKNKYPLMDMESYELLEHVVL